MKWYNRLERLAIVEWMDAVCFPDSSYKWHSSKIRKQEIVIVT